MLEFIKSKILLTELPIPCEAEITERKCKNNQIATKHFYKSSFKSNLF